MDNFVHLQTHSAFSSLWGTFTPEDLVQAVASIGQKAVALTDTGLHGAARFYKAAVKAGIQPILGVRVNIWDGSQITLLTKNSEGYRNLCQLVSISLDREASPNKLISKQSLNRFSMGLICLAGGRDSNTRLALERSRFDSARFCLLDIKEIFKDFDAHQK